MGSPAHASEARPSDQDRLLRQLITDGFVRHGGGLLLAQPRWHAALARAAMELHEAGEELTDVRVPIAWAVTEAYGERASDVELATLVWLS